MKDSTLQDLADKKIDKKALQRKIESNFEILPNAFAGLSSPNATVRYACASALVQLSAKYPERIYPQMDQFVTLLNSKYRILTWNGMAAIANLCKVDRDKKFEKNFEKFYSFINNDYLVTVANVVANSEKIAHSKPHLIPAITNMLLRVEDLRITPHLTEECKRVVAKKAIAVFNSFFEELDEHDKKRVRIFVKKHTHSSRASLKIEAEQFLNKWGQA